MSIMRKIKENVVAGCSLEGTCRTLLLTTSYKSNAKLCFVTENSIYTYTWYKHL